MNDLTVAPATPADMANAIRALSMDAVQLANSGHPGMPMGMAEIAVGLWSRHLLHNPSNPNWPNRDRFVLSNGHGSMLLYSLLHLTGYDLTINDLKQFRQLHARTPGHPERGYAPGVETTTGPLGQGIANAVGMAMAEQVLAATFNRPGFDIVDHRTFVFLGDGCLMEGISHEACSLAGTLGLNKLIALYDDNGISIDGHVKGWFGDDTAERFKAYGWNVIPNVDGHDVDAVDRAIGQALEQTDRPTLICCKTVIGKGSPNKADSHASHGSPLGSGEVATTRGSIGWGFPAFEIPKNIYAAWDGREAGAAAEDDWNRQMDEYRALFPDLAGEFERRIALKLPQDFGVLSAEAIRETALARETIATRKASQNMIQQFAAILPELVGGSADLTSSNLTDWMGADPISAGHAGNYLYYGVREFAMAAIMNGMLVHGGFRPFGGTFLVFSDYARNAIRMSALMKLGVIYVLTHDSIALGQDGPTHQPIEHLASLRLIPDLDVWRPCDTVETAVAWQVALEQHDRPSCLALSRQNLKFQERKEQQIAAIRRGGYVLAHETGSLQAILIATGSEVELAMEVSRRLCATGVGARVVSMPSTTIFDRQDLAYQTVVIPRSALRISIEAGTTGLWRKYVGEDGICVGIDSFGESAPAEVLFDHFGFTAERIEQLIRVELKKLRAVA